MSKSYSLFGHHLQKELSELKKKGLYKEEKEISSSQRPHLEFNSGEKVINLSANNYLGLADDPRLIKAAKEGLSQFGFGLASVRFISGTQTVHHRLEEELSLFLKTDASVLYSSCFDANGGLFETLLGEEDAVISDSLNHASIIDGIRLCKAKRFRYQNNDMTDLEEQLKKAQSCRFKLIATDGVFSMDGIIANLKKICDLADIYGSLVMVDDSHGVGVIGESGRGTPEYCDVMERVDLLTGTFGKALGGASGGYTSGKKEMISWLRQRSRPYLFSNALAPAFTAGAIKALEIVGESRALLQSLAYHTAYFRQKMASFGFSLIESIHPIVPIILKDALLTQAFAKECLQHQIYVVGFCYPVVPEGFARIRVQISAKHTKADLDRALEVFKMVGKKLGIIS